MGYQVKIQRVERGATKSFYINFPAAIAEACKIEKGEEMEWIIEDKNTFVLQRVKKLPSRETKEGNVIEKIIKTKK
jgi:bifunctional DNA-binding transcriptional regulator/antitoxin component of YhaV-PrlF toxin-antitoxin module